jgi:hypothetical protein
MSDLRLREFAARAEELVTPPDLADLDRRGRALRQRRRGGVAALVACALAVVGLVTLRDDPGDTVEPAPPPNDSRVYPGPQMRTLEPGSYVLLPSFAPGHPQARLTMPAGWNSWVGPNRFDGHAPGRDNGEALERATWYVGVLVIEVDSVASGLCDSAQRADVATAETLSRAVSQIPGYRTTREAASSAMFGYPATHLQLRSTLYMKRNCVEAPGLFNASGRGLLGSTVEPMDVWVVDVDGTPVLVVATWSATTPTAVRQELAEVIDSIEFFIPQ